MPPPKSIFIGLLLVTSILSGRGQFTDPSFNLPFFPDSVPITEIVRQTEALPGSIPKSPVVAGGQRLPHPQGYAGDERYLQVFCDQSAGYRLCRDLAPCAEPLLDGIGEDEGVAVE